MSFFEPISSVLSSIGNAISSLFGGNSNKVANSSVEMQQGNNERSNDKSQSQARQNERELPEFKSFPQEQIDPTKYRFAIDPKVAEKAAEHINAMQSSNLTSSEKSQSNQPNKNQGQSLG